MNALTRRNGLFWGGLLFLPAVVLFYPLLLGRTFFAGDMTFSFQPWLTLAAQEIQRGRLPLWNPYSSCGEPLLANPQVMGFHPAAVLFWLFPFPLAWGLFLLLNQTLLIFGAYCFFRRSAAPGPAALATAATAWGASTAVLWEFPAAGATLGTLFFAALFARAGRPRALAVTLALLVLSGYTPFTVYGFLAVGAMALVRLWENPPHHRPRAALHYALALGLGLALAAPQLLLSWEAARTSIRTGAAQAAREYLLSPAFLIKFLVPDIFDKVGLAFSPSVFSPDLWPVRRNWLNAFYMGTPAFLLGLTGAWRTLHARRREGLAWAGLAGLAVLLALGVDPVFTLLRKTIPGLSYLTHFSNATLLLTMALAWAASRNDETISRDPVFHWTSAAAVIALAVLCFSPLFRQKALAALLGSATLSPAQDHHVQTAAGWALGGLAATWIIAAAPRKWRFALWTMLTLVQLTACARGLHPWTENKFFHDPSALAAALDGAPGRLAMTPALARSPRPLAGRTLEEAYQGLRETLFPNTHLPYRVPETWSYEIFGIQEFADFRRTVAGPATGTGLQFLGASHILSAEPLSPPARFLARTPAVWLYGWDRALPRVTWVPRTVVKADPHERVSYLSTEWDPAREVVLEKTPLINLTPVKTSGKAEQPLWKEEPGRITVTGDTGPGWLALSHAHYPGWRASINGAPAEIHRANHAFMALPVPPGPWRAAITYEPPLLTLGGALSLTGLILLGILCLVSIPSPTGGRRTSGLP
jgi:hypothetical protein